MRVIGVDPGIARLGYSVLEEERGKVKFICGGVIETPPLSTEERLYRIYTELRSIVENHRPDEMALEDFVARNLRSALKIGEARGIALLVAREKGLKVFEYSPTKVKRNVSGYGRGRKEGIKRALSLLLDIPDSVKDDMADAIAISLCHLSERRFFRAEGDRGNP